MCFDELHAAIFVKRRADTAAGTRLGVSSNVRLDIGCWTARLLHDCLKLWALSLSLMPFRGIMCRLCGEVSTRGHKMFVG